MRVWRGQCASAAQRKYQAEHAGLVAVDFESGAVTHQVMREPVTVSAEDNKVSQCCLANTLGNRVQMMNVQLPTVLDLIGAILAHAAAAMSTPSLDARHAAWLVAAAHTQWFAQFKLAKFCQFA